MLIYNIKVSRNLKMDWYQKYISLLRQNFFTQQYKVLKINKRNIYTYSKILLS